MSLGFAVIRRSEIISTIADMPQGDSLEDKRLSLGFAVIRRSEIISTIADMPPKKELHHVTSL